MFYCLDDAPNLDPSEMRREEILAGRIIFVDGFQLPAAVRAAEWGREAGRVVLMDAERAEPENDRLVALSTHVVASHRFAESRVGKCDFRDAARRLHEKLSKAEFFGGWAVVVDDAGAPMGWIDPDGARRHRDGTALPDCMSGAGSLFRPRGNLSQALDAALSSPSGVGIAVDDDGRVIGGVLAADVLAAVESQRGSR